MKKILSKIGAKIDAGWKKIEAKERLLDLKSWAMGHLGCVSFWKAVVLISLGLMLQLGASHVSVLKLGLLSWGGLLMWKHGSDHAH